MPRFMGSLRSRVKGSGRTIDSRHCRLPRFRQHVTLLTDPINNCFVIHRLLTVVSRGNRRAILTFPTIAFAPPTQVRLLPVHLRQFLGNDPARLPLHRLAEQESQGVWLSLSFTNRDVMVPFSVRMTGNSSSAVATVKRAPAGGWRVSK